MKRAKSILGALFAVTIVSGAASAQSYDGRVQPLNIQQPSQARTQAGGADFNQFLSGGWTIQTSTTRTTATYMPNGEVQGVTHFLRTRQSLPFKGRWTVSALDGSCFRLSIVLPNGPRSNPNTLCVLPDGNLYNQTASAIAFRTGPSGG